MRRRSPPRAYHTWIPETPPLTAGEEKDLSRLARDGDRASRDRMTLANLRLVVSIARGYLGCGLDLEDLVGDGTLGLMRAVDGYDPDRGIRFTTYAYPWIKDSIRKSLYRHRRSRISGAVRDGLEQRLRIDSDHEASPVPREATDAAVLAAQLPPNERETVALIYGLSDVPSMTYSQVVAEMGLPMGHVMGLERTALARLRQWMGRHAVAPRSGRQPSLPDAAIPTVLQMIERGIPQRLIAAEMGVSRSAIDKVSRGKRKYFVG